jgi:hypothetical protein
LPDTFKICPICEATNHRNTAICLVCGTTLTNINSQDADAQHNAASLPQYDYRHGETDLLESDLRGVGKKYMVGIVGLLIILMFCGLSMIFVPDLMENARALAPIGATDEQTSTPRPTLILPTITPAPPTLTPTQTPLPSPTPSATPTPEPCYQEVRTGDFLYSIVGRCGHIHPDVIDLVVEINNLADANSIRQGAILEIPWPTNTPDPNAVEPTQADDEAPSVGQSRAFDDEYDPLFIPTATLPPGIQFHVVESGDNIAAVGYQYNASVEILSQLNPEIDFSRCDLGSTFGGPNCIIFLSEGQYLRVPAPTPTPTLSPTLTGNETLTPTPTATFNAPSALSPDNRMLFYRDELITLRWVPSGTLSTDEIYRVRIEDTTTSRTYIGDTREVSFVVPEEWRGEDEARHEYVWTVSVINVNDPNTSLFTTESLIFVWEGQETK